MSQNFTLFFLLPFIFTFSPLLAQQQSKFDEALRHMEKNAEDWGLESADLMDVIISHEYIAQHNGAHHFYFVQRYGGIPLYQAVNGVHFNRAGKIVYATNNFVGSLAEHVNTITPQITPQTAVYNLLDHLSIPRPDRLTVKTKKHTHYTFAADELANNDFDAKLSYYHIRETGEIRLAWHITIDVSKSADYWSSIVDAVDGKILHQYNYTLYTTFVQDHQDTPECTYEAHGITRQNTSSQSILTDGATYNVFPLSVESPIHGERELVMQPADSIASPFGWHDTDGMAGAEYTITRGNNVHAYIDADMLNMSTGDEPDGGAGLLFDFYFDRNDEPENIRESAVTQLFYTNNIMHDLAYAYGFTEEAGNFQALNYSGAEGGGDPVLAEAQDGSGTNNATFTTPPDGFSGRMQMFRWFGIEGSVLNFSTPASVAGSFDAGLAEFGPSVSETPITGEVIQAFDGSSIPILACGTIANADEIAGKIALIDRGDCRFEEKTNNAEAAGAIAVIICNYVETALAMSDGINGSDPGIVTISMGVSDCQQIKDALALGETVTATIVQPEDSGPESVSSSMDNSIIAHEYAHGISIRLTGGAAINECLTNDEQQGEGWSDFFALIISTRPDDVGETPRGIGTYAARQSPDGRGIRRLPYSTDLASNDHTMDDIINTRVTPAPHPLGEVWASAIWDLYWAMADLYGYDDDLINGTGGNNMAIQLVMDGLVTQSCNPGFMDARNALIIADNLNYGGIHECLIWEVFARRGMGVNADQSDKFNRNDNVVDFNVPLECHKTLKIIKSADKDLVVAGDNISYTLIVRNDKDEVVTGVTIEDELPIGLTYLPGSASGAMVTDNDDHLTFNIGELAAGEQITIAYEVSTSPDDRSAQLFYDDIENGDDNWELEIPVGFDNWFITTANPHQGENSWFVRNSAETNDQIIRLVEPFEVNGLHPTLRFYHDYNTQPLADGGLLEISRNGGMSWETLNDAFIRNEYRGELDPQTLFSTDFRAFWGDSNGYIDSYIDLSAYQGETIQIRFRFASNSNTSGTGWYMDDFEIMDKLAYEGEACVSSNEGDIACAHVPQGGVIVDTDLSNSTSDLIRNPQVMQVYPNPTHTLLNIVLSMNLSSPVDIEIVNAAGAVVRQWRNQAVQGQLISLNVNDLPTGFYVLRVNTPNGIFTEKVAIQ